jgi:hypothetical protein
VASSVVGQIITVQAENKKLRFAAVLYSVVGPNFNAFLRNVYLWLFIVFTAAAEYSISTSIHFLLYTYIKERVHTQKAAASKILLLTRQLM